MLVNRCVGCVWVRGVRAGEEKRKSERRCVFAQVGLKTSPAVAVGRASADRLSTQTPKRGVGGIYSLFDEYNRSARLGRPKNQKKKVFADK
jgi:hypothetical protein